MRHGASRYAVGCRCEQCRDGHRVRMQAAREAARDREVPTSAHGTVNGYGYWDCRCDACLAAKSAENRRYRMLRRK